MLLKRKEQLQCNDNVGFLARSQHNNHLIDRNPSSNTSIKRGLWQWYPNATPFRPRALRRLFQGSLIMHRCLPLQETSNMHHYLPMPHRAPTFAMHPYHQRSTQLALPTMHQPRHISTAHPRRKFSHGHNFRRASQPLQHQQLVLSQQPWLHLFRTLQQNHTPKSQGHPSSLQ